MSAIRREKFQDSNALIQLSRQLQAKQLADSSVTALNIPADPAPSHQRSRHAGAHFPKDLNLFFLQRSFIRRSAVELVCCPPASSKRQKLLGSFTDNDGPTETVTERRKTAAKTMPANLQSVAQIDALTTGQANELLPPAEQAVSEQERDRQKLHTATIPQRCLKKLEPFDFVTWYSKICTHAFADGLSALQHGHDSSHAHPRLIAKCITMNALLLEAKKDVFNQAWHLSPFQHASQRL